MNLGAHVIVAAGLGDDPVIHLGAALPDVATIGGFRMVPNAGTGRLGEGIALHHATDEAFHGHPWFLTRQKVVFDRLTDGGVRRGAARASAHVGVELLLDGELFGGAEAASRAQFVKLAFDHAAGGPDLVELVPFERRPEWLDHLSQLHRWRSPSYFSDPGGVAHRMQQILLRRPRLAMTNSEVPLVASALAEIQPSIIETAEDFVQELTQMLAN